MPASGNFAKLCMNGIDITPDGFNSLITHAFLKNPIMPYGVGIAQQAVGAFDPKAQIDGYINSGLNASTMFNLLAASGIGATDIEYLVTLALGQNTAPVIGDIAYMAGYTLSTNHPTIDPKGVLTFQAAFLARGRQTPLANVIANYSGPDNAAALTAPAFWDNGTNAAAGTTKGGGAMLHVLTPTGTAAAGNITVPSQPVAADTVVVNGVTFTWVAALSAVPGQVKIGASALASAQNLYAALTQATGGNLNYVAVSAANILLLNVATYSVPSGASNTISINYKLTGTTGNAYTLTKTGTGGLAVSGATLTGGIAGDALTFTVQTCATSGGAYVTVATFTSTGAVAQSEYQPIAIGTTINEFVKCFVTGGAGQTVSFLCAFGRYWST